MSVTLEINKMNLVDGREEFERTWNLVMRNIGEASRKSTLGCHNLGVCLVYQTLIDEKKRKNIPKQEHKFHTISRQYYEYLSVEELMDVDLVWVHIGGPGRWICTKCYEKFKQLWDLIPCCGKGEGYDS